jgi:hypothetical protein
MTTTTDLKKLYSKGKKRKLPAIFPISIAIIARVVSISFGTGAPRLPDFCFLMNRLVHSTLNISWRFFVC